jgi:hypothetical protein
MGNELGGRFDPRIKSTNEEGSITMLRAGISGVCTDYAQNQQAPHAQDAKKMSSQIKAAANNTGKTGEQKVNNWWNQLADWTGQKSS